jgi:hypothetical protein
VGVLLASDHAAELDTAEVQRIHCRDLQLVRGTEQSRHLLPVVVPEIQLRLPSSVVQTLGLDEHPEAFAATVHPPPQPIRAHHFFLVVSEVTIAYRTAAMRALLSPGLVTHREQKRPR